MSFAIRTSRGEDLDRLAAFAATAQADPERFCAYLAETADGIAAELAEAADWPANGHVALDDQRNVVGWLVAETDADMGRVWWWGPFVGRSSTESALVADALLSTGLRDHPEREHELAADAAVPAHRRARSAPWLRRRGGVGGDGVRTCSAA